MFDLNPLDVLKKRKLNFMPPHFVKTELDFMHFEKTESWVRSKLKGRYCIVNLPVIDHKEKLCCKTFLGLEDPKELTYYMLAYKT